MRDLRKGRKLGRERNQRRALLRSLASHLILYGKIRTTIQKAKELRPYAERLVSYAKKGGSNGSKLLREHVSRSVVEKLMKDIAPRYKERSGGYTRIIKSSVRRAGDGAQSAYIEFVK